MPVENGQYDRLNSDEIRQAIESELKNEFGADIDLTQSSVFSTLAEVLATVLADNQEQSLQDVYRSAFLDTATGKDLDRVVSIIGIQRRDAIHATGVEEFSASGPVDQDYVIQKGTTLQTESDEPIEFETTERIFIELIDNFESGDLSPYSGDTGSASITTSNVFEGDEALELDATDGAHVYRDDVTMQRGSTNHAHVRPGANNVNIITFFVDTNNPGDYYQIVADNVNDELRLERVKDGSVAATIDSATGVGFTDGAYHEIEFRPAITDNISVTLYDPDGNELASIAGEDNTYIDGAPGFKSGDANSPKQFDYYTQSAASANIRAISGGARGNVGPNSITVTPSPPTGVDSVTNLYPTGNTDLRDTDGSNFVPGQDEEDDEQLRERAQDAVTGGGSATFDAIVSTLVNDVTGVSSVTVYENKTDTDNTGSGGLPPHSFEAVVFGGDPFDIAEAIFEEKAVTANDYGGAHGTKVQETVVADSNGQEFTIQFTRPTELDIDLTLDIVVNDEYIGDDALRDSIVQYVGGVLSNGTEVEGLGVGDDVIVDQIQDIIVGPDDTGVVAMDESVDGDPISSTPSSTTVNGIEVIDVGQNEVAQLDGTDASITINKREV